MTDMARHTVHGWTNSLVRGWRNEGKRSLRSTRPRLKTLSVLVAATLSSSAYAQVVIPSSASSVQLQTLSPGSSTFVAPASTVISVFTESGVVGDNSQNWQITNFGTITSAVFSAIELGSASANGARLDNYGSLLGSANFNNPGSGVSLTNGGTINNHAAASIGSNNFFGILASGAPVTISNDGTISGSSSAIRMGAGGSVTQSQTGTISSNNGVGVLNDGGPLTLSNAGTIISTASPAVLARGTSTGTITNSGLMSGAIGVQLANTGGNGVVLTNTGTITGTGGTAVSIGGSNNTLALGTGSTLNGNAVVTAGANNQLVLQGTGSAGNAFTGFAGLTMSGTSWLLSGNVSTTGTSSAATTIQTGTLTIAGTLNNGGSGGGTTINPGAMLLIGNGGASGSVTGNIVDNGSFGFNRSDTVTYGSLISGTGSVIQQGSGTTIMTAANTYTGATIISAGTLQIGSGGTSGSIVGDVTNSGTLHFNRSDTATYGGVVSGTGPLTQAGTGTLVLTGNNTYTGGTTINGGTLQLGNGGTSGSIVGDLNDGGALIFNRSDSQVYNGTISGSGSVTQAGSGTVIFNGVQTYSGSTNVTAGTLAIGDASHAEAALAGGGTITIGLAGALGGYGQVTGTVVNDGLIGVGNALPALANGPDAVFTIVGNLDNRGTVTMANGATGDRLVVSGGTYTANGGRILMDSVLNEGGAASRSDMLVAGATLVGANGATRLSVNNVGGAGSPTIGNGIMVVQVQDPTRSAAGAFSLLGRAVAGPYEYQLFQGGKQNADGNWYLRSEREQPTPPIPPTPPSPPTPPAPPQPLYRPEVAAYLANQRLAGQMFVHSLHDRQGDATSMGAQNTSSGDGKPSSAWVRMTGRWEGSNSRDGNFKVDTDSFLLQGGTELAQWKLTQEADRLHLGVMAGYASASSDARAAGNPARAQGKVEGYSGGVYGTWYQNDEKRLGAYVDTWFQYGWFDNQVEGDTLPTVKYKARGWGLSGELGYAIPLQSEWVIEPQGQLIYVDYREDSITEANGTRVDGADSSGVIARLGARAYRNFQDNAGRKVQPYVTLNWWHTSTDSSVSFNQLPLGNLYPANRYELKLGLNGSFGKAWTAWGNVAGAWGEQSYHQYIARVGVRYAW